MRRPSAKSRAPPRSRRYRSTAPTAPKFNSGRIFYGKPVPTFPENAPLIHQQTSGAVMSVVTLAQASTIVDTALKKGRDTNCAPLTVAVLDAGGHLVAFKREDKSGLLRFDIAFGKAWGALGMGFGSRTLAARAAKTPQFFTIDR